MARRQFAFKGNLGGGYEGVNAYGAAVTRTFFTRFIEADIQRNHGEEVIETSRLAAPENVGLGDYDVNFQARVEARPETVGKWLKAFAGDGSVATTTPATATTTRDHAITSKDVRQPITLERRLGTLDEAEVVDGGVISETTLEFVNRLAVLGFRGIGRKDAISATPTTPTFDAKVPWMRHHATVTLGGTVFNVRTARVRLAREVTDDDYGTGSRYRIDADVGRSMGEADYELFVRDTSLLKRSLGAANATAPVDTPLYNADSIKLVSDETVEANFYHELEVTMPRAHWQPIGIPMRTKEGLVQRVRAKLLYDEASAFQWRARVRNSQTSL